VGYRAYDARNRTPMFPFGFGLSYTSFGYRNLTVGAPDSARACRRSASTSATPDLAPEPRSPRSTSAQPASTGEAAEEPARFTRVALDQGQTQHVTLTLDSRAFQFWSSDAWTNASVSTRSWSVRPPGHTAEPVRSTNRCTAPLVHGVAAPELERHGSPG